MEFDTLELITQADILGVVVSLFPDLVEDHAIDKCSVHISHEGKESYLELSMYNLQEINPSNSFYGEPVTRKRLLTQEESNELYNHIKNMTDLPDMIKAFHTELVGDERMYASFNVEYIPTKQVKQ
ncbi:hypothetical protein [Bacillus thuringiensis]|uniref:hypothetical protein n=1 Tax=Bacillus thuringiensis TaxID=1428 RepID=UPI000BF51FE9|nr:hypothetical protein [Bacillus thuringiensis]PES55885.1 hypothetical protein CN499_05510 [Bacillus thuringiensis]